MAYADAIRSATATLEDIASLIEGIASSAMPTTLTTYVPTWSGKGSMTFTGITNDRAEYVQIGKVVWVYIKSRGTIGGTLNNEMYVTLPVTAATSGPALEMPAIVLDPTSGLGGYCFGGSATLLTFIRPAAANYSAGSVAFAANIFYRAA